MRRLRRQPLIVLLCALFLLGAQQAAYAHFLSHLGIAAETAAQDGGANQHGAETTLSHVCTTCAALSALDGAAPPLAPALRHADVTASAPSAFPTTIFGARPAPANGARAPPSAI